MHSQTDSVGVLLVGAGPMAIAYTAVLRDLGITPTVVGRGSRSARAFTAETGLPVIEGGLARWRETASGPLPSTAVVACGEKWIGAETRAVVDAGIRRVLTEKPGGFDAADIEATAAHAARAGAAVFVGYNRRFYGSTDAARRLIQEDGGVRSFTFEFTEWSHVIAGLEKEDGVKEQWFLSNSTHVIDLAFHLGGRPADWRAYTSGALSWHPAAAIFAGAGRTDAGALFSYVADWAAPGRFGLEVLTARRRLIFRPLETLQVQPLGTVRVEPLEIAGDLDVRFKPGLYRQVRAFLGFDEARALPTIDEQAGMLGIYRAMRGDRL